MAFMDNDSILDKICLDFFMIKMHYNIRVAIKPNEFLVADYCLTLDVHFLQ